METKENLVIKWHQSLKKATDFDSWGQLVEAASEYVKLSKQINYKLATLELEDEQSRVAKNISSCLQLRAKALQSVGEGGSMKLEDIKKLIPILKDLFNSSPAQIPVDMNMQVEKIRKESPIPSTQLDKDDPFSIDQNETENSGVNTILPKLAPQLGLRTLTVTLVKIGLKDAAQLIDPYITISCKDLSGVDLCQTQTTPVANEKDEKFIIFNRDVEIQMYLENIKRGTAIYFALYHYKAKQRSTSMKCYSFMEVDELKQGPCCIELYKKPFDYRRKKLTLLTSKPLFLHLNLSISES